MRQAQDARDPGGGGEVHHPVALLRGRGPRGQPHRLRLQGRQGVGGQHRTGQSILIAELIEFINSLTPSSSNH